MYHWYISFCYFWFFWSLIGFTKLLIILSSQNYCVIFYLQHPPSHKYFAPWDVEHLFKLAWKTATLLALVTAKCCSDVPLLCIDNQHLFLQCNAAIFIPMSGGKTDHLGHLPLRFILSFISMLIFALFFI